MLFSRKKSRKAQMEIMGLAIIFILVIFGVLFAVRFVITKPQSDVRKEYQQSILAAAMLSGIRGTTSDCKGVTVEQLLQDCAAEKKLSCPPNLDSCQKAKNVIEILLRETLYEWKKAYNFSISGPSVSAITFANGDCSGEKEVKTHPVPTRAGTITLKLELCG